ncbi:MAG: hypothetical protein JNN01_25950 [Opitutaceae bacterium]|nr:hypothetical protein [Opitutaceae bacterium]
MLQHPTSSSQSLGHGRAFCSELGTVVRGVSRLGAVVGRFAAMVVLAASALLPGVASASTAPSASLTLSWTDNSNNEAGFRIERGTDGVTFSQIATVAPNVTTYVDEGLLFSTRYVYRVCAYNSAGSSDYTTPAGATTATPVVTPPPNAAPTITNISNQSINANTSTGALAFTVGDAETPLANLVLTVSTSNSALVPLSGIVLGGSGASRTVAVTPASGQTGTATITVTVSDGSLSASDAFDVVVNVVNTPPTISDLPNRVINANSSTGTLAVTVGDALTPAGSLVLTATSSNPTLVPESNVVFGGSGASRTVVVTPAANQSGSATITITVSDGTLTASDSFVLTVNVVNTPPTVTEITNRSIDANTSTGAIGFTVGDAQSAPATLTLSGSSTNTALIATSGIVFGGSGANRTVTVTPVSGQTGSATVTVTISDGVLTASESFVVTVNAVNSAPTLSAIAARVMDASTTSSAIPFTVGDAETPVASLAVSAASSNPTLLPVSGIALAGSGASRTVTLTPTTHQTGTATVTLTVSDGLLSVSQSFQVTVNAVNTAPTISGIADRSLEANRDTGLLNFTVGDAETPAANLVVTVSTSNPTLLPVSAAVLGGTGGARTVKLTPAANQTGLVTITLTVSDGDLTAQSVFILTVNAPITAPTISDLTDRTINAGASTGPIAFSVGHATAAVSSLVVTGSSSNAALVPAGSLVFGGSDSQRTLTVTPAAGQTGTATITVVVSDGNLSTSDSFVLTVNAVNAPPTVSEIADLAINANTASGAIAFTVGDALTPAGNLIVSGNSSNPALLPVSNIVFGGSGAQRTVLLTPAANQKGSATITITVSDGSLSATEQFVLTVNAVNTAPTISDLLNRSIATNGTTGAFPFTIGDTDTPATALTVTAVSSNPTLLPAANLVFGGTGANRTLSATPAANQTGTATVTVTVSDGVLAGSTSFVLTVSTANSSPTITEISNRSINANSSTGAISFTVGDAETPISNLAVSATSSNPALVPVTSVVISGSGANRSVSITPVANQTGSSTVTLTVSDGALTDATSFVVTVEALVNAPTITAIGNRTVAMNASTPAIAFTVGDAQVAAGSLTVSASSSNPALVPSGGLVLGGSGSSRTLVVTPAANQTGTATLSVTVSNGTLDTGTSFVLTVQAPNTPPTLTPLSNRTIEANGSVGPLALTVGDSQTPVGSLTLSGASSNSTLLPAGNIVFGGTEANRSVTVTPAPNQTGTATVTVTVSDGSLTSSINFVLTVTAVNTAPTISTLTDRTMESNATSVPIGFTVSDGQTAAGSLTVTAVSSNSTLLSAGGITLGGSGGSRTLTLQPAANQIGTTTVTLTVSDGALSSSTSFVLTVNRPNTAPTISPLSARSTVVNSNSGAIEFTIGDEETSVNSLYVTGSSSNQTLLPFGNIVFGGSGANRTVVLTPATNQIGTTTVTVTVSDGRANASTSFVLTVTATSTVPKISDIPNRTVLVNSNTSVTFTVSDAETAAGSLVVTGSSTNTALIGPGSLVFGGSGGNRTVLVTPLADRTGTAVVTLTVSDGKLSSSSSFSLVVLPAGNTPTISRIANRTINANSNTGLISFVVDDANTPATNLTVTAASSNPALIPVSGIALGGYGSSRTVVVTPAANQVGSALITLTVSDGGTSSSYTFVVNVLPVNLAPTMSDFTDRSISADGGGEVIGFTIDDVDTVMTSLSVVGSSSNAALLPSSAIVFSGTGNNRTLTVTPVAGGTGVTTITVTVSDGALSTTDSFVLTVTPSTSSPNSNNPGTGDEPAKPGTGGSTETPATVGVEITQQPQHAAVAASGSATLQVVATGPAPLSYQWYEGDRGDVSAPVVGGTGSTLTTRPILATTRFWVRVSSATSSATSQAAVVSVGAQDRFFFGSVGSAGTGGNFGLVVRADGTGIFLADAAGLGSGAKSVDVAVSPAGAFSFQVSGVGTVSGQISGSTVSGVIAGSIPFTGTQDGAGGATSALAGVYRGAVVFSADGSLWILAGPSGRVFAAIEERGNLVGGAASLPAHGEVGVMLRDGRTLGLALTVDGRVAGTLTAQSQVRQVGGLRDGVVSPGRLVNMSVRAKAGEGSGGIIAGFTVGGSGTKSMLLRAIGPTLGLFGVSGVLSDPIMTINRQGSADAPVAVNDNWVESEVAAISQAVGAFPLAAGSKDAALFVPFAAGGYTAQLTSVNGSGGSALIELYDADNSSEMSSARLVNLSIRTEAGSGDNVVITGFNVSGNRPKRLLIRAIGPELAAFGVAGSLPNPMLSLVRSSNGETTEVAANDDWGTQNDVIHEVSAQLGAFALTPGSKSAALVVWVSPGTYTALARSGSDTTGVLIVEVYEVP